MKTNFINTIKYKIQLKLYKSVVKIQRERTLELFRKMLHIGKNFYYQGECHIIGPELISIGDNFYCGQHARIEALAKLKEEKNSAIINIGDNFSMGDYCHIGCVTKIEIGNGVLVGSKVLITDHNHGSISKEDLTLPPVKRLLSSKPVSIGNNVWIGDNVCIMPGVTLGDNVIVGANAVVTHSFQAGSVIAGCPAKLIKNLYE